MNIIDAKKIKIGDTVKVKGYPNPRTVLEVYPEPTPEQSRGAFPLFNLEDPNGAREIFTYLLIKEVRPR